MEMTAAVITFSGFFDLLRYWKWPIQYLHLNFTIIQQFYFRNTEKKSLQMYKKNFLTQFKMTSSLGIGMCVF